MEPNKEVVRINDYGHPELKGERYFFQCTLDYAIKHKLDDWMYSQKFAYYYLIDESKRLNKTLALVAKWRNAICSTWSLVFLEDFVEAN